MADCKINCQAEKTQSTKSNSQKVAVTLFLKKFYRDITY